MLTVPNQVYAANFRWGLRQAAAPVTRPISLWVEDEIVLPNGPFAGQRYRHHRHPVSRLWFEAVDSGKWSRFAGTGPTQNGKTLMLYVAPVLYHLFEMGETVIVGIPSMDMANDKWQQDFLPVIRASRYADLLPLKGEGSKGGQVKRSIAFRNGATLRFMSGGGGDKKRAGYTSRVLAITETDGMDEAGETSREADKIEQLEGRTRAYGRTGKRVYLECTVSIEKGRIWQEVHRGTGSRIARPCPHCGEYVTPEREHLVGWGSAENEEQAAALAHWSCPACEHPWSEADRKGAARLGVLVHRGQTILKTGEIAGPPPETQTFGLRWSAIDNPFVVAADLGAEEWLARKTIDQDSAERKMRQFVFSLPYEPPVVTMTPLDPEEVQSRTTVNKRGVIPSECVGIAVQVDTGKKELHWEAKAVQGNGCCQVIDYGVQTVRSDRLGVYRGLIEALGKLRVYFESGWAGRKPDQVWIDSGYYEHTDAVYAFCESANAGLQSLQERYRPSKGYGEGQRNSVKYRSPTGKGRDVKYVGREMHMAIVSRSKKHRHGVLLVHVNSDYWKSEVHQRLAMPVDEPGAVTLFNAADDGEEHREYVRQVTAEHQVEKMMPARGPVVIWERDRRDNHYLDTAYGSLAAAHFILDVKSKASSQPPRERPTAQQLAQAVRK